MWLRKAGNQITGHITSHPITRHYHVHTYEKFRSQLLTVMCVSELSFFRCLSLFHQLFYFLYFSLSFILSFFSQRHSVLLLILSFFSVSYSFSFKLRVTHSGRMINCVGCGKNKTLAVVRKCPNILLQKHGIILLSVK